MLVVLGASFAAVMLAVSSDRVLTQLTLAFGAVAGIGPGHGHGLDSIVMVARMQRMPTRDYSVGPSTINVTPAAHYCGT